MDNGGTNINVQISWITLVIQVLFIIFKILGIIDWPWIWVFAPIWIPVLIILGLLFLFFLGYKVFKWFMTK